MSKIRDIDFAESIVNAAVKSICETGLIASSSSPSAQHSAKLDSLGRSKNAGGWFEGASSDFHEWILTKWHLDPERFGVPLPSSGGAIPSFKVERAFANELVDLFVSTQSQVVMRLHIGTAGYRERGASQEVGGGATIEFDDHEVTGGRSVYLPVLRIDYKASDFPGSSSLALRGADIARRAIGLVWVCRGIACNERGGIQNIVRPSSISLAGDTQEPLHRPADWLLYRFDPELMSVLREAALTFNESHSNGDPALSDAPTELWAQISKCESEDRERILRSLHFVPSFMQGHLSEKSILWLCIAFETLLLWSDDALSREDRKKLIDADDFDWLLRASNLLSITERMADRLSLILGGPRSDREYVKRLVRRLYRLRSKIAHGSVTRIRQSELAEVFFESCEAYRSAVERTSASFACDDA